jgi:hypothetical protein
MKGKWVLIVEANNNKVVVGPFDDYDQCVDRADKLPNRCGWTTSVLYPHTDYQGRPENEPKTKA